MSSNKFEVRNVSREELDIMVEWAASEGWNPGLHDVDCFYSTDPTGYFMGFLSNQPITCISAVAYNDNFGFLGFYITKPEFRGQGYGIQVWKKGIDYLKTQNVGLDGVFAQQENYKKSGFTLAYSNIRYQDIAKHSETKGLVKLSEVSFEKLVAYDSQCFPVPREKFLKCWITMPESHGTASVSNGGIIGYGVIRKCKVGYKVGPLFADTLDVATNIYRELCNQVKEEVEVFLDVPEVNRPAVSFAESSGMKKVFGTARMYTKEQPKINLAKIFGVTTFELG